MSAASRPKRHSSARVTVTLAQEAVSTPGGATVKWKRIPVFLANSPNTSVQEARAMSRVTLPCRISMFITDPASGTLLDATSGAADTPFQSANPGTSTSNCNRERNQSVSPIGTRPIIEYEPCADHPNTRVEYISRRCGCTCDKLSHPPCWRHRISTMSLSKALIAPQLLRLQAGSATICRIYRRKQSGLVCAGSGLIG